MPLFAWTVSPVRLPQSMSRLTQRVQRTPDAGTYANSMTERSFIFEADFDLKLYCV